MPRERGAPSERLRILGVDPGSVKAGWGIVDVDVRARRLRHVDNGVLLLGEKRPLAERLVLLSRGLHEVVESFRPHLAAVEDVYVSRGPRSALVLGQARGAALATLGLCGVPIATHTSSQVKLRVTGRGRATKHQMAQMVSLTLSLPEEPFEDAADALAVALCHGLEALSPVAALPRVPPAPKRRSRREGLLALARAQGKV